MILTLIHLTSNPSLESSQHCPRSPLPVVEMIAQSQTTLIHYHQKIPTPLTTAPLLEKLLPSANKPLNPPAVIRTLIHLIPYPTLESIQHCPQSPPPQAVEIIGQSKTTLIQSHLQIPQRSTKAPFLENLLLRTELLMKTFLEILRIKPIKLPQTRR